MFSLRIALVNLVPSFLTFVTARSIQVPLAPSLRGQNSPYVVLSNDPTRWNLEEIPNPNTTSHLVFNTAYSLLQHWPNVRLMHGHNIVPGIIPKGTLLYHASDDTDVPTIPEWVALDPEHSYWTCGRIEAPFGTVENPFGRIEAPSCWYSTLVATRTLKVVYFDGLSAVKEPYGLLDTQDLLIWGESDPERTLDERRRINTLCEWGRRFDVDGFNGNGFVMLCDFTSGVSLVSVTNITSLHGMPPNTTERRVIFEAWHAGSWHNYFPGETRIQLDLSGLVSFYDTQLAPSLVAVRAGQKRHAYRVRDISKTDLSAAVSRLEAVLTRPPGLSSGIDWRTLLQVVVNRYAGRLELTHHLLTTSITTPDHVLDLANKTQMQLRIMLTPYLSVLAVPTDPSDDTALGWTASVYEHCAMTHTRWMESMLSTMTDSEKLILRAVRGTTREICRVVTKMWAAGVYAGLDSSVNAKEFPEIREVSRVWHGWGEDLNRLMAWLDWSVWTKCEPGCDPEEMCVLFPWPQGDPKLMLSEQVGTTDWPVSDAWQPKCVAKAQ